MAASGSSGVRIAGLSLDCEVPADLIRFYVDLLDGELLWQKRDSAGAHVSGLLLIAQRVSPYLPPTWPGTSIVDLDLSTGTDLDETSDRALSLGAVLAEPQPDPRWRVPLDPAGHPFCITTVIAD